MMNRLYTTRFRSPLRSRCALNRGLVISEVRSNSNLKDVLTQYIKTSYKTNSVDGTGYSNSSYDADDFLDDLEDELDYNDGRIDDDERIFRMSVWVKGNEVVAREIDKIYQLSGTKITYQFLMNSKAAYINFSIKDLDGMSMSLKGGLDKESGAWSGTLRGNVNDGSSYYPTDINVTAKITGLKVVDKMVSGTIKLTADGQVDGDALNKATVAVVLSASGNKQAIKLSGAYTNSYSEYDFGELLLTYSLDKVTKLNLPNIDEDYGVIVDNYSSENIDRVNAMYDSFESLSDEFEEKWEGVFDRNPLFEDLVDDMFFGIFSEIHWYAEYYYQQ